MGFNILSRQQLYPATLVNRLPPQNIQPGDEKIFRNEYSLTIPPVFLYHLKNVHVSADGIIFNRFRVFPPALVEPSQKNYLRYLLSLYFRKKKIKADKEKAYLLVVDEWSNGYFHWMCDVLPKLIALQDRLNECVLLIPENYTYRFISETLQIFRIQNISIIPLNSYFSVEDLLVPAHTASVTGNYNPQVMHSLRKRILQFYSPAESSRNEKIYVSRKKTALRHIINEQEVIRLLSQYGFKEIYFEDYSLREQVSISCAAQYMISLHGGNLVNMLFMPLGGAVLEFRRKDDIYHNGYYALASAMNLKYYYQLCDYITTNAKHPTGFDVWVDIKKLEENVLLMLNAK